MLELTEYYLCYKDYKNHPDVYRCDRYQDFNRALVQFRRNTQFYYDIKTFNSTIIPIWILNPFKKQTVIRELSKQFNDLYISKENVKFT